MELQIPVVVVDPPLVVLVIDGESIDHAPDRSQWVILRYPRLGTDSAERGCLAEYRGRAQCLLSSSAGWRYVRITSRSPTACYGSILKRLAEISMPVGMSQNAGQYDVFISYAREDRRSTSRLAEILEKRGFSVWWDQRLVPGSLFDRVIERKLRDARCVLVLWSARSIRSNWVNKEAKIALKGNKLLPLMLEETRLPRMFRRVHAANFVNWDGSPRAAAVRDLSALLDDRIHPPGGIYSMDLEMVTYDSLERMGLPCSGMHLVNCLNRADAWRRSAFLSKHGILELEPGRYSMLFREEFDRVSRCSRTVPVDPTEWLEKEGILHA